MKKTISILAFIAILFISKCAFAQQPKQHVFYDTVKTVKERVDYAPDTIPVYFKEITFSTVAIQDRHSSIYVLKDTTFIIERWLQGFLVWQTYKKQDKTINGSWGDSVFVSRGTEEPKYYEDDYGYFNKSLPGTFLYSDRKTKVNDIITACIKR